MIKEQSYIQSFSDKMLSKYGLNLQDKEIISSLIKKAIDEKLYTDTKDYQHNLKHIEKVIAYVRMIVNKMNHPLINEEILMYAALYHDIGKTMGASNQEHGIVGAAEFKKMMQGKLDDKSIEIISRLIYQHASESDLINFENANYTDEEKKSIQLTSDILKDADALDRNRLNYPAPIGTCDINKLRTNEAKEILGITDSLYNDYCSTIISQREKETGKKILDNYELLEQWIQDFNNGEINMFHASLDPSVDILRPTESTQKGAYVYAGISPVNCVTMAAFRSSTIFPRTKINGKRAIMEIFPGSLEKTLGSKYITIYKLPNDKFHEYIAEATAAPTREWVSSESVEPIEQISFKALDLLNYLKSTNQLAIIQQHSKEKQFESYMQSFQMYIWGVKSLKEKPDIMNQKWKMVEAIIIYYSKNEETLNIMNAIRKDLDTNINSYIEKFKKQYGREPNYDNENECLVPILHLFEEKYYKKDENGKKVLNFDYINSLYEKSNAKVLEEQSKKR